MSKIEVEVVSKGETGLEPPRSEAIGTATRSSGFGKVHRCVYVRSRVLIKVC
jgi:hypothetical protein